MSGLLELASAILKNSERRLESISQNISNANSPGYKKQVSFTQYLENNRRIEDSSVSVVFETDHDGGNLTETGNPLDIAISGKAYFLVRDGDAFHYSRSGQFSRNRDGAVADSRGMILQQAGGGDLVLDSGKVEILNDGTVLIDSSPVGVIGLFEASKDNAVRREGGSLFAADPNDMVEAENSTVRQGMIESSNVTLSDEMVSLMANARQAEMGGQIVRYYDQLIGQAITTFSRSGK